MSPQLPFDPRLGPEDDEEHKTFLFLHHLFQWLRRAAVGEFKWANKHMWDANYWLVEIAE